MVGVAASSAKVLPFKTVTPNEAGFVPYQGCVPLVGLQVAARAWSLE